MSLIVTHAVVTGRDITPADYAGAHVTNDNVVGYPESYGAVPNDGTVNNYAAIVACLAANPISQFANADYFYQGMLPLATSHRLMRGVRGDGQANGRGTRLIRNDVAGATGSLARIGLAADPGAIASYVTQLNIDGISFNRDIAAMGLVAPHASGLPQNSIAGIDYRFIKDCRFAYVGSFGNPVGHSARNVVNCKWHEWRAARNEQSSGTPVSGVVPNDVFVGFDAGGDAAATGLAGANASIRIGAGNVTATALYPLSTAVNLWGYCADTYVSDLESAALSFGVIVDGRNSAGTMVAATSAHQNIRIDRIVADACPSAGIMLRNLNASGTVNGNMIYAAPTGTGAAVNLTSCAAQVRLINVNTPCATTATGIRADSSSNFNIRGSFRDAYQVANLNACFNFDVALEGCRATSGGIAAVALTGSCSRSIVALALNGAVNAAYSSGISADSTTTLCEFNGSRINTACLTTTTPTLKVLFDGADASTGAGATAFTTANNVLQGVKG